MTTDQIIAQVELQKGLLDALRDKATFILKKNNCLDIAHLEDKSKKACEKEEAEAQELLENRIAYYQTMADMYHLEGQIAVHKQILAELQNSTEAERAKKEAYKAKVESVEEWKALITQADKAMQKMSDKNEKRRVFGLITLACDVQKTGSFEEKMNAFIALEQLK